MDSETGLWELANAHMKRMEWRFRLDIPIRCCLRSSGLLSRPIYVNKIVQRDSGGLAQGFVDLDL